MILMYNLRVRGLLSSLAANLLLLTCQRMQAYPVECGGCQLKIKIKSFAHEQEKLEVDLNKRRRKKTQLYLAGWNWPTASVLNYLQGAQHVHVKEGPDSSFRL